MKNHNKINDGKLENLFLFEKKILDIFLNVKQYGLKMLSIYVFDRKEKRFYIISSEPSLEFNYHRSGIFESEEIYLLAEQYESASPFIKWEDLFSDKSLAAKKWEIFDGGLGGVLVRKLSEDFSLIYSIVLDCDKRTDLSDEDINDLYLFSDFCYKEIRPFFERTYLHLCLPNIKTTIGGSMA